MIVITICVWIAGMTSLKISENAGYSFLWAYVAPIPILFAVIELLYWFGVI